MEISSPSEILSSLWNCVSFWSQEWGENLPHGARSSLLRWEILFSLWNCGSFWSQEWGENLPRGARNSLLRWRTLFNVWNCGSFWSQEWAENLPHGARNSLLRWDILSFSGTAGCLVQGSRELLFKVIFSQILLIHFSHTQGLVPHKEKASQSCV